MALREGVSSNHGSKSLILKGYLLRYADYCELGVPFMQAKQRVNWYFRTPNVLGVILLITIDNYPLKIISLYKFAVLDCTYYTLLSQWLPGLSNDSLSHPIMLHLLSTTYIISSMTLANSLLHINIKNNQSCSFNIIREDIVSMFNSWQNFLTSSILSVLVIRALEVY